MSPPTVDPMLIGTLPTLDRLETKSVVVFPLSLFVVITEDVELVELPPIRQGLDMDFTAATITVAIGARLE